LHSDLLRIRRLGEASCDIEARIFCNGGFARTVRVTKLV
jgi:hypothetical protein